MRRSRVIGILVALGWAASVATPAAAQTTSFVLRYQPDVGSAVRTVTHATSEIVVYGFPTLPDGSVFETSNHVFGQQLVRGRDEQGWRVEIVVDSVHARGRPRDGVWSELDAPIAGVHARAIVNDRLSVVGIETSGPHDSEVLRILTGMIAGLGFAFPGEAVPVGSGFDAGRMPFTAVAAVDNSIPVRETLLGDLGMRLDSIQIRGADTLAHLQFTGTFVPRELQSTNESSSMAATFTGAFAGRLIWSTGWNAFVSGATRVRASAEIRRVGPDGQTDARVGWETVIRHRIVF